MVFGENRASFAIADNPNGPLSLVLGKVALIPVNTNKKGGPFGPLKFSMPGLLQLEFR
jgi:hypothetical protein